MLSISSLWMCFPPSSEVEQLHKTNAFIGAELSSRHKGRAAEGGEVSLLMPSPCLTHEGPMFTRSPAKP